MLTQFVMTATVYTMCEITAEAFGRWLRSLREDRGESLRVVGAEVGMDPSALSRIEHGGRLPTKEQAADLAGHFEIARTDIQARRIAAEFVMKYGEDECAQRAVGLVKESFECYGTATDS
ncbi:MAG: helix-turn-helix transcriptional regulator [Lentisphaerae bacterium]|nr:helix-turn-helix transcriptional regulator [Lentisphaerota bacterium]